MNQKLDRGRRIRAKIRNLERPRLTVFVSNKHIYAQIIDDRKGKTLVSGNDSKVKAQGKTTEVAKLVGKFLAEQAKNKKITEVFFDRGSRKYHGRVKALADSAREGGLKF